MVRRGYVKIETRLAFRHRDVGVLGNPQARTCLARRSAPGVRTCWMWASGHNGDIKRTAYGYEPTREGCDGGVR